MAVDETAAPRLFPAIRAGLVQDNLIRGDEKWRFPRQDNSAPDYLASPFNMRQMRTAVRLHEQADLPDATTGRQAGRFGRRRGYGGRQVDANVSTDEVVVFSETFSFLDENGAGHVRDNALAKMDVRANGTYYTCTVFGSQDSRGAASGGFADPAASAAWRRGLALDGPNFANPAFYMVSPSAHDSLDRSNFAAILQELQVADPGPGESQVLLVSEHPSVGSDPMTVHERTDTDTTSIKTYLFDKVRMRVACPRAATTRFLGRGELQEIWFQLVMSILTARHGRASASASGATGTAREALDAINIDQLFLVVPDRGRSSRTAVSYNVQTPSGIGRTVSLRYGVRKLLYIDDPRAASETSAWTEILERNRVQSFNPARDPSPTGLFAVGAESRLYEVYRDISARLLSVDRDYETWHAPTQPGRAPSFDRLAYLSFLGDADARGEIADFFEQETVIDVMKKYVAWFSFGAHLHVFADKFSPRLQSVRETKGRVDAQPLEYSSDEIKALRGVERYYPLPGTDKHAPKVATIRGEMAVHYRRSGENRPTRQGRTVPVEAMLRHPFLDVDDRFMCMTEKFEKVTPDDLAAELSGADAVVHVKDRPPARRRHLEFIAELAARDRDLRTLADECVARVGRRHLEISAERIREF